MDAAARAASEELLEYVETSMCREVEVEIERQTMFVLWDVLDYFNGSSTTWRATWM